MTTEQPTTQETTTEEVTEEATTAAKNNTASNVMDADDGYIFPDADTSYVSKSSVKKLSDEELQYAVNEVYHYSRNCSSGCIDRSIFLSWK